MTGGPTVGQRLGAVASAFAVAAMAALWLSGGDTGLDRHDFNDTPAEQHAASVDG